MRALLSLVLLLPTLVHAGPAEDFERYSGARLVFERGQLGPGDFYDSMPSLEGERRAAAARVLLREARKYPPGYLGAIGLKRVGVFAACVSKKGDGFRPYEEALGGYRYFGQWNGADTVVAAWYSDTQLPLTFHHEVFHHVDSIVAGVARRGQFSADDARFAAAVSGRRSYPALDLSAPLKGEGYLLEAAVSDYAAKSPGEDQAETARYLMTTLPDALRQMAGRPGLPGSQRMLHVLAQYERAHPSADAAWFEAVAGGDAARLARVRARIVRGGEFVVWGHEDDDGVNHTLRRDLRWIADELAALRDPARAREAADLVARYRRFIAARWALTAGTERAFQAALAPARDAPRQGAPRVNPHLAKVDAAIDEPGLRRIIRRVQPATVRVGGGSGVNLASDGLVLTAAHVPDRVGRRLKVSFPDGRSFAARCVALDAEKDLALLRLEAARDLPVATIAPRAGAAGDTVVVIGQPGRSSPDGGATGYQPFHVSVGSLRGLRAHPYGAQALGGLKHDAWTYWGHSGSPLFDARGRVVGLHNSWDSTTAMRHAVPHALIARFLAEHRPGR